MTQFSRFIRLVLIISIPLWNLNCTGSAMNEKQAQKVLNDFYTENVPEEVIGHQLWETGERIVPYVLVEIQKKEMPRRGYAILSLGKIGDRRALAVLTRILEDMDEPNHIRADALRAIWHIDGKCGEELASKHAGKNNHIDRTIELLRGGKI